MAVMYSQMMPLGTNAIEFDLMDTDRQRIKLGDFANRQGLLIVFMCNHCPYVKHVADQLRRIGEEYIPRGIGMVGINSNDAVAYPDDGFDKMQEEKKLRRYPFPYLWDETQEVGRAYDAACTPDFYLFDKNKKLFYRGRLDETRPSGPIAAHGTDLRAALDALLSCKRAPADQKPSIGCSIKWRDLT